MSRKSKQRNRRNKQRNQSRALASKQSKQPAKYVPRGGGKLFASPKNDITIPFYTDVLENQDPTLIQRGRHIGLKLYDEILQDGRARSTFNKRLSKLTRREWKIEAASEDAIDVQAAEQTTKMIAELPFDQICKSLLKAILKGYAVSEIIWHHNKDGLIAPQHIKSHDPARFKFDHEWNPRLLVPGDGLKGIEVPKRKFITHRFEAEANNPYGKGLGSVVYWHVLFKRQGVSFWLIHLEKFGSPIPVAKYPQGLPDKEQEDLFLLLQKLVQSGALAVPMGTEIDFVEAKRAGEVGHQEWCRYWDEQTSEVILGSTLSTSVKGEGSRAATETHAEESESLVDDDSDQLSATLNDTLIKWICEANWPNATPPILSRPRPVNEKANEENKKKKHERQQAAIRTLDASRKQGFEPKDVQSWMGDVMDTEMVPIQMVPVQTVQNELGRDPHAKLGDAGSQSPTSNFASDDDSPVAHIAHQLADLNGGTVEGWIDQIKTTLHEVDNFADASQALLELAPNLEVDQMGQLMGDAIALADLHGRADIVEHTGINPSKPKGSKKKT